MSRGINKVILVGNLGADPETRYTAAGMAITSIRIATSESWKDKNTGEQQEKTEWHRIKFFGRVAEIAGEYLKKGSQVYVEGKLRTDKYTDKDGIERYSTDIIADEMQMLGSRSGAGGGGGGGGDSAARGGADEERSGRSTPSPPPPQSRGPAPAPAPAPAQRSTANVPPADFDDDIPF